MLVSEARAGAGVRADSSSERAAAAATRSALGSSAARWLAMTPSASTLRVVWTCLTRAFAEDDNSEECAILCESGARPGVLWFAS